MVGIELPDEERLPAGSARDLVIALHELYRGAGRPGLRRIAKAVASSDFTDTVSHEAVSSMLNGEHVPRWFKIDCVVRQLAVWNAPQLDPGRTAELFLSLWEAAVGIAQADFRHPAYPDPANVTRPQPDVEADNTAHAGSLSQAGRDPLRSRPPRENKKAERAGEGFFGLLDHDERAALAALALRRRYSSGETIYVEGDSSTDAIILVVGWVKVLFVTTDGHEVVLALRGEGDILGEMGEIGERRDATVRAVGLVDVLIVRYDEFNSFLDSNLGADRAYRRLLAQRLKDSDKMLRSRATTVGAQRFARLLIDLADQHGRNLGGEIHLPLPLTQAELASLAGTSRATVTRAISNWRRRGLIRTGQRHLTITDPAGFRRGPSGLRDLDTPRGY
jgi:CRP/FNR family transcriptional regulator, cyclic AMP receptor protein